MQRGQSLLAVITVFSLCCLCMPHLLQKQRALADVKQEENLHVLHAAANSDSSTQPPVWPEQFKSVMFQNRTNKLALVTLYYDWKLKANLNIISSQLGGTVWDLEWNNGTSFIFSRDQPACKTLHFDVGILTPDWLAESTYLGQTTTDDFVTNVWTKAKFINYYADKDTSQPVRWTFLWSDAEFHTMEWSEGTTLHKDMWQAPHYCFDQPSPQPAPGGDSVLDNPLASGRMMRLAAAHDIAGDLQLPGAGQAAAKLPSS